MESLSYLHLCIGFLSIIRKKNTDLRRRIEQIKPLELALIKSATVFIIIIVT